MVNRHLAALIALLGSCVALASCICFAKENNHPNETHPWFECYYSQNYTADISTIPSDLNSITLAFYVSDVPVLREGVLSRFGENLWRVAFTGTGIKEIEDRAFEGLTQLEALNLKQNRLETLKAAWFESLRELKFFSADDNAIKRVESNVFAKLPSLVHISLRDNDLPCLDVEAMSGLTNLKAVGVESNPLTWRCRASVLNWTRDRNLTRDDYDYFHVDGTEASRVIVAKCLETVPRARTDDKALDECARAKFLEAIADPSILDALNPA